MACPVSACLHRDIACLVNTVSPSAAAVSSPFCRRFLRTATADVSVRTGDTYVKEALITAFSYAQEKAQGKEAYGRSSPIPDRSVPVQDNGGSSYSRARPFSTSGTRIPPRELRDQTVRALQQRRRHRKPDSKNRLDGHGWQGTEIHHRPDSHSGQRQRDLGRDQANWRDREGRDSREADPRRAPIRK